MRSRRAWAGALVCGLILVTARAASAHAVLESTNPTQGSEIAQAPATVSLHFGEGVGINQRSLEVLDPAGHRVDDGSPGHPAGDSSTVEVRLRAGLPRASYAVLWHVVSADSHPVGGAFSFGVGVPAGATPADVGGSTVVGALAGGFRALAYAGAALLGGGLVFLLLLWPAGLALARSRLLLRAGLFASVISAAALFLIEGPYGAGLGLGTALQGPLLSTTLGTDFGRLLLVRLALLTITFIVVRREFVGTSSHIGRGRGIALSGLGVLGAATFSFGEHSGQGIQVPLAAPLDMLHVMAASIWLGGLVMLAVTLLTPANALALRDILPRWSRVGMVCVAVLVGSGLYLTWREVGSLHALTGTTYGQILLVKVGLFAVMLGFAEFGRRWVSAHATIGSALVETPVREGVLVGAGSASSLPTPPPGHQPPGRRPPGVPSRSALRQLRASVAGEAGIGVGVLVVTAILVNGIPARQAYTSPYSKTVTGVNADGSTISVTVDLEPANVGRDTMHLYTFTTKGVVLPYAAADSSIVERAKGVGPIDFSFSNTGPGHGTAEGVVLPVAGLWDLTVQIHTDALTDYAAVVTIPVR